MAMSFPGKKKPLLFASAVLNIGLIVFIANGHIENGRRYAAHSQIIYTFRTSLFELYPVSKVDIVMLGDSITQAGSWAEMFPGRHLRNRGISGDQTRALLQRLDDVTEGQPRAVFLKIGTNDLGGGVPPEQSYQAYRSIVEKIRADSPRTILYLQSLLPRGAEYQSRIVAFNQEIRRISEEFDLPYIDLHPHFLDADGSIRDSLSLDELHLTGDGYRLWEQLLAPHMAEIP